MGFHVTGYIYVMVVSQAGWSSDPRVQESGRQSTSDTTIGQTPIPAPSAARFGREEKASQITTDLCSQPSRLESAGHMDQPV